MIITLAVSIILLVLGLILFNFEKRNEPIYRFANLNEEYCDSKPSLNDPLSKYSLYYQISENKKLAISLIVISLVVLFSYSNNLTNNKAIFLIIISFAISVVTTGKINLHIKEKFQREISRIIPLVMERLVMAVEAGLDIIPAIKSVVEIDKLSQKKNISEKLNFVIIALDKVISIAEKGTSFDEALKLVAMKFDNHALTHCFVHLGIAYKEGGELIGPLRELSDATQNYYQETVEEDLAKLPVKATAPLVVTFAGLLLFFLASPLVQLLSFTSKVNPQSISNQPKIGQKGSGSLFFIVFVLPILMLIGTVIVDIQNYSIIQQNNQAVTDDATHFAVKYLPNQSLAIDAARNFVSSKINGVIDKLDIQKDYVGIVVKEDYIPRLASYFARISPQSNIPFSIPIVTVSASRLTPTDLYILVDRGSNTAPNLNSIIQDRFGNSGDYPLASSFTQNQYLYNGNVVAPEIALEQCFNPKLHSIKLMASRALDLIRGVSINRVALSFMPGSVNFVGQNSRLSDFKDNKTVSLLDTYIQSDNDSLVWIPEFEDASKFPVQSLDCYSLLKDTTAPDIYHFPYSSIFADPNTLTLSDVVWSRVSSNYNVFDLSVGLSDLQNQIFRTDYNSDRGGLANSVTQIGLIFSTDTVISANQILNSSGDSAWNSIGSKLNEIRNYKSNFTNPLKIYYFVYKADVSQISLLQSLFDQYKLIDSHGREVFSATAIAVDSVSKVLDETLPFIVRGVQRAVIKQ